MESIKQRIKRSAIYNQLFFGFYCLEKALFPFRRKSFAEFAEDFEVENLIGNVRTFVDIGANDGYHSSNTFYWALRGARGVCFEPIAESFFRLKRLYAFNRTVSCKNVGISDSSRETAIISLDVLSYIPSTLDDNHKTLHEHFHEGAKHEQRVKLERFSDAIRDFDFPLSIDLLSIDVEGHELNVLRSIPFDQYSFKAIVLETHCNAPSGMRVWTHRDLSAIEKLLADYRYRPVASTMGNTIYLNETNPRTT